MTDWASFDTWRADFTHHFGLVTAATALIIVNWHWFKNFASIKPTLYLSVKPNAMRKLMCKQLLSGCCAIVAAFCGLMNFLAEREDKT